MKIICETDLTLQSYEAFIRKLFISVLTTQELACGGDFLNPRVLIEFFTQSLDLIQ